MFRALRVYSDCKNFARFANTNTWNITNFLRLLIYKIISVWSEFAIWNKDFVIIPKVAYLVDKPRANLGFIHTCEI